MRVECVVRELSLGLLKHGTQVSMRFCVRWANAFAGLVLPLPLSRILSDQLCDHSPGRIHRVGARQHVFDFNTRSKNGFLTQFVWLLIFKNKNTSHTEAVSIVVWCLENSGQ